MKKLFIILTVGIISFFIIVTKAATSLVDFKLSDGTQVYINRSRTIKAQIPTEYQVKDREFRAVWMSQFAGDIPQFSTKAAYMANMNSVLNNLQEYNINAIMYHIRIMNDALYDSDLNPISGYVRQANFAEWDYLEWLIDEVHRRGMEFHAWMNPYRIQNKVEDAQVIANRYQDYPQNPASDPDMLLIGSSGVILNPGEPRVREFIIDTSMEVIEKYDVDAIHFDDYFYISMNGDADLHTYNKYKHLSNTNNIANWRREQVDIFIKDLSDEMRAYNTQNNRQVQLGISPSGIWRNGNGVVSGYVNGNAVTNGSDTAGFAHYDAYLYSDTKKWIDNEWIDYIVPQVYWAFTKNVAMHAGIVNWWQQVVKYKNVNLYIGMGLYMIPDGDTEWNRDPYEAANQALYSSQFDKVGGMVIYKYQSLVTTRANPGVQRIRMSYWNKPALAPEVKTLDTVVPSKVSAVNIVKSHNGYLLTWDQAHNARKYAIYRNTGTVDIDDPNQLVGVVGYDRLIDMVAFNDVVDNSKSYNYAVVSVSGTNTKGEAFYFDTDELGEIPFEFAEMPEIKLSEDNEYYFGSNISFEWEPALVFYGSNLVYEMEYSFDQFSWNKETSGRLRFTGSKYTYSINYPEIYTTIFYRVKGSSEMGTMYSEPIELSYWLMLNDVGDYVNYVNLIISKRINNIFKNE